VEEDEEVVSRIVRACEERSKKDINKDNVHSMVNGVMFES
jgi:hypothetical protein